MKTRRVIGEAGFTLVELMISLVVLSMAISAAFAMAFSLMDGYKEHRQAIRVESTTRIVLDMLAGATRSASPGLTSGKVWDVCSNAEIDTVELTNFTNAADSLRLVHAAGGAFASIEDRVDDISDVATTITVVDNSMFEADLWTPALVISPVTGKAHLVEILADGAVPTTMTVRAPAGCVWTGFGVTPTDLVYEAGSFIVRAVHVEYAIDDVTYNVPFLTIDPDGPNNPTLDAEPVAEGVEDLQIAVAADTTDDQLNNSTWFYDGVGGVAPLLSTGQWRALRITVIGRSTRDTDERASYSRPTAEDHLADGATDVHRRRAFSTTVELRNFASAQ